MTNIYILKLEDSKYYIGKSENVERRFQDHMNGNGSVWTRKYKPIEMERVIRSASSFDEDKFTKEYMSTYGIDNVRGGSYTTIELSDEQKEFLTREIWGAKDLCGRCGDAGHFIRYCTKPPPPLSPISIPRSRRSTPESLPDILRPPTPLPEFEYAEEEEPVAPMPMPMPMSSQKPKPLIVEIPPTLTIPNPVFVIKNWFDTTFAKLQNEFTNPESDLRSGRIFKKSE